MKMENRDGDRGWTKASLYAFDINSAIRTHVNSFADWNHNDCIITAITGSCKAVPGVMTLNCKQKDTWVVKRQMNQKHRRCKILYSIQSCDFVSCPNTALAKLITLGPACVIQFASYHQWWLRCVKSHISRDAAWSLQETNQYVALFSFTDLLQVWCGICPRECEWATAGHHVEVATAATTWPL